MRNHHELYQSTGAVVLREPNECVSCSRPLQAEMIYTLILQEMYLFVADVIDGISI